MSETLNGKPMHWKLAQRVREFRARDARRGRVATHQGVPLTSPVIRRLAREYRERLKAEAER